MKYEIKFTSQFKDLEKLCYVIEKLAQGKVLEPKYYDHNL